MREWLRNEAGLIVVLLAFVSDAAILPAQVLRTPESRDSAGVRIITHRTIRDAPNLNLISSTPSIDLGGLRDDPREEFAANHMFPNAARLSDGRIVVVDKSSLKLMDAKGKVLRIIGRDGEGPGEFSQIRKACITRGDSIITADYVTRRINVFNSAGDFVRTHRPDAHLSDCFADGTLLIGSRPTANPASAMPEARARMLDLIQIVSRYRSDGTVVEQFGTFPSEWGPVVFPNKVNLVVYGDGFLFSDGNPAEIREHDAQGRLVRIIRWNDRAIPVTAEMIRTEGELMGFTAEQIPRLIARVTPDSLPTHMRLLADVSGRLWIEDHYRAPSPRGWTVFDPTGTLLGKVHVRHPRKADAGVELLGFSGDFAVLTWKDEDDATHVSFHLVGR